MAVIEDAAQAYLATYRGALAGTMGDIACIQSAADEAHDLW